MTTLAPVPVSDSPKSAAAKPTRVAIGGFGAIGQELVRHLAHGRVPGVVLTAVSARNRDRAHAGLERLGVDIPALALGDLEPVADVVVECAPAELLPEL